MATDGGRTSRSGYSRVAIALHWTIAILLLGNVVLALMAEGADKALAGSIMGFHKSIGLTVLMLTLIRLAWRLTHGFPRLPDSVPTWNVVLARSTHVAFYVLLITVPLAGWAMASAGPYPLEWFGLFDWPKLPVSKATGEFAHEVHEILAFTTIGLVVLHVAGALKHHFMDRNDVLARMLPLVQRKA